MSGRTEAGVPLIGDDHPFAVEHAALAPLLADAVFERDGRFGQRLDLERSPGGHTLVEATETARARYLVAAVERHRVVVGEIRRVAREAVGEERAPWHEDPALGSRRRTLVTLIDGLLALGVRLDSVTAERLAGWPAEVLGLDPYAHHLPYAPVVEALEAQVARESPSTPLVDGARASAHVLLGHGSSDLAALAERLAILAGPAPDAPLAPGEAWADRALTRLTDADESTRVRWAALFAHCRTASGGKPSARWAKTASTLLDALGSPALHALALECFPAVDLPRSDGVERGAYSATDPNRRIGPGNGDVLKGLAWCCAGRADAALADALGQLALSAYRKIPGLGPRATKVGNAAVWALGGCEGETALSALVMLRVRVKFLPAQKGIAAALTETAERAGLTLDALEEIGVPAFGLEAVGERVEALGEHRARLRVDGTRVVLGFETEEGRLLKGVPAAVREHHGDELKDLRRSSKDIERMLVAQRERLDGLFLLDRIWTLAYWRTHYLDHPLTGTLVRRLVWRVGEGGDACDVCWSDGALRDVAGNVVTGNGDETPVALWHPMLGTVEEVLAWRERLAESGTVQPFKQAHREVYVLTDAERRTGRYSNRFAAHVVKQHQFNTLAAQRGWRTKLWMMVDDAFPPATRALPAWGLKAEYLVHGAGDEYETDTLDSGAYVCLTTDQVRFRRLEAPEVLAHASGGSYGSYYERTNTPASEDEPLALEDIPPIVLSEVLRDVDLFVGVASIGNDPDWHDGGPAGRYGAYWRESALGEIDESARTRRALFETLLPRLKIADRCALEDRWLLVQGERQRYRIHLGSGNVLIDPEQRYLCIVRGGKSSRADVALPFEGDGRTSEILSKAFLLVNDRGITDSVILTQLSPPV